MKNDGKTHVLIVDDDLEIRRLLAKNFSDFGISSQLVGSGIEMRNAMNSNHFDAIILDLMLPGENGLTLCSQIRKISDIPIILLTARGEPTDKVVGLELGADDYVVKPFDPRELIARLHTILRRSKADKSGSANTSDHSKIGEWKLSSTFRHLVSPDGTIVPLSNAEFRLLLAFVEHPDRVLTREYLMDIARGNGMTAFDRSIDLLVSRLRRKLQDDPRSPKILKTIRGEGYVLDMKEKS